ncbi:MAG: 60S ribosomal protein L13A [Marteilia pararefringens]
MHYASYLRKHVNTDHGKGQFHHRNPRGIMRKAIRGMVPRKTVRGQEALSRVTVFEGVPRKYEKLRKHTVPAALHHLHAKYQKFTKLSSISNRFGWKYSKVVENFEAKRKLQAAAGVKRVLKSKSILQQAKTRKSSELQSLENRYLKFFEVSV